MEEKVANYKSCFDVIGPVMVGPSSSHTAGALQIGLLARRLFGETPQKVICTYYESFAETHKGHGTDYAIISGVLGFPADDERVPFAVTIAEEAGMDIQFIEMSGESPVHHANTADLTLISNQKQVRLIGASVGGGAVEVKYFEIDEFSVEPTGPLPILALKTSQEEQILLEEILHRHEMRIAKILTKEQGEQKLFTYELDTLLSPAIQVELEQAQLNWDLYILK